MYENSNSGTGNRFIFSDDFYNNLENNTNTEQEIKNEPLSSIEIPSFEPQVSNNEPQYINNINQNQETTFTSNLENINPTLQNTLDEEEKPDLLFSESKEEKPNLFSTTKEIENTSNEYKQNNDNNSFIINTYEEEKPDLLFPNTDIENVNDNSEFNINNTINEPEPISYNVPTSNQNEFDYNVESGIDTSLEEQLLKPQSEYTYKPDIVNNSYFNEKQEKTVYRAIRRPRGDTNNSLDNNYSNDISNKTDKQSEYNLNKISSSLENERPFENKTVDEDINWKPDIIEPVVIKEEINYYEEPKEVQVFKSDLLERLTEKENETGKISILARYGEDFCSRDYITNPAIGRDNEIKELGLILITPEKSAILVGKPGIGKTSIVEGLAYRIQRGMVPEILKGYTIISIKTTSLLGTLPNGETRLQTLIDEIKDLDKIILFIDEIHMLMGATHESGLDFANMFKESLGRGSIKMIGATTSDEYERYVLRDKAFVRRFQRVDVKEPTKEETVEILMGTLPKIEKTTHAKLKYTHYIQVEIMNFIVDITTEYKRVYGIGSRYPDICITLINQAFSEAIFNNRNEVNILDIRNAIANSKNIYPDVIRKELMNFDEKFKNLIDEEKTTF